jgi:hypothetical protein
MTRGAVTTLNGGCNVNGRAFWTSNHYDCVHEQAGGHRGSFLTSFRYANGSVG